MTRWALTRLTTTEPDIICDFNQCFCRHTDTGLCTVQSGSVNTAWLYNTRSIWWILLTSIKETSIKWHWSFSLSLSVCMCVYITRQSLKTSQNKKKTNPLQELLKDLKHHCPIEEKVRNHRRLTLNMENFYKRLILEGKQPTGFSNIMTDGWSENRL